LTWLGLAGAAPGYDPMVEINPAKRRLRFLFRPGCVL
jgi:hypothetical protein